MSVCMLSRVEYLFAGIVPLQVFTALSVYNPSKRANASDCSEPGQGTLADVK